MSTQSYRQITHNGLWKNNPALVQLLGLCPTGCNRKRCECDRIGGRHIIRFSYLEPMCLSDKKRRHGIDSIASVCTYYRCGGHWYRALDAGLRL